jgi:hypothetical protein
MRRLAGPSSADRTRWVFSGARYGRRRTRALTNSSYPNGRQSRWGRSAALYAGNPIVPRLPAG